MNRRSLFLATFALLFALLPLRSTLSANQTDKNADTILKPKDITAKLFPETVFFRGQSAPVQMRNTTGVHFADDLYVLMGLVDNSGYSSNIRAKYQAYLITEVPIEIGDHALQPGAYGFGFIEGPKFIVLDLGANDLFTAGSQHDAEIKHPVPLQILPSPVAG